MRWRFFFNIKREYETMKTLQRNAQRERQRIIANNRKTLRIIKRAHAHAMQQCAYDAREHDDAHIIDHEFDHVFNVYRRVL